MRRTITLLVAAATIMTVTAGTASAGRSERSQVEKTDVCHYDADTDEFHLIRINGNAVDKHLDHGDHFPGTQGLDDDCVAAEASLVASGAYSENGLSDGFTVMRGSDGAFSGATSYLFGSHSIEGTITDACLDRDNGVATVWGPAASNILGDGFLLLSIADRGDGLFLTKSKFLADPGGILTRFETQCEGPSFFSPDGSGHLSFW
jgi:hypothetical protein